MQAGILGLAALLHQLASHQLCWVLVMPSACGRRQIEKLELEPHLNTCFRHFMLFTLVSAAPASRRCCACCCAMVARGCGLWAPPPAAGGTACSDLRLPHAASSAAHSAVPLQEFNLIDERELAPLKELIDRMVR